MFQLLAQNVLNALQLGSVYALIALGYTMVYGILTMINFAHGDIFMVGTYLSLAGAVFLLGLPLKLPVVVVFLGAMTFSMLLTALLGVSIERLAYRPLRQAPRVSAVITALGVGLFLENITLGILGPQPRHFPDLIPLTRWEVAGLTLTPLQVLIIVWPRCSWSCWTSWCAGRSWAWPCGPFPTTGPSSPSWACRWTTSFR